MWIECICGNQIKDVSDGIRYKAKYISDKDWFYILDKAESLIESDEPDKEKLCREFQNIMFQKTKDMYQCTECGRLFVDNKDRVLSRFTPELNADKDIFNTK